MGLSIKNSLWMETQVFCENVFPLGFWNTMLVGQALTLPHINPSLCCHYDSFACWFYKSISWFLFFYFEELFTFVFACDISNDADVWFIACSPSVTMHASPIIGTTCITCMEVSLLKQYLQFFLLHLSVFESFCWLSNHFQIHCSVLSAFTCFTWDVLLIKSQNDHLLNGTNNIVLCKISFVNEKNMNECSIGIKVEYW